MKKSKLVFVAALIGIGSLAASPVKVSAAACTAPSTDYGTITQTLSMPSNGTYRIWTRMSSPSISNDSYLLDIDSTSCYTVGGANVPVYSSGATTYFSNDKTNWISTTSSDTQIDVSLTSGTHTLTAIGTGEGLVIDRMIVTKDVGCTPTGTGSNCASVYYAADIDQNGSVNFLDFSRLAAKYGQSGGSLGRTDINIDGTVDFLDLSLMASTYGG